MDVGGKRLVNVRDRKDAGRQVQLRRAKASEVARPVQPFMVIARDVA